MFFPLAGLRHTRRTHHGPRVLPGYVVVDHKECAGDKIEGCFGRRHVFRICARFNGCLLMCDDTDFKKEKKNMLPQKKLRKRTISSDGNSEDSVNSSPKPSLKRKASSSVEASKETSTKQYSRWILKSEPQSRFEKGSDIKFGIEDLKALPNQTSCWDGVRNYQARNFMRQMKEGQLGFFYHSSCKEPGIVAIVKIVKEAYVDHTQFDTNDAYFDATSREENPKWSMVDVQYQRMLKRFLPLAELKQYHIQHRTDGGPLKDVMLFTRMRLSVQPLTSAQFDFILNLEDQEPL
ncbi:thymocyte nuclear protein 1 isoform X2 [Syngnathoides biaculeatus]|uniref:thymocyte nuclear protein 1 isoform X2 n=1 Tax=Syngnathoides biaculeatus TaxID=300417 RepID=UPI002ADE2B19|nr:thymocyte nuclear protein 1 isoform X2 [Syngnathoides biaculeatus]